MYARPRDPMRADPSGFYDILMFMEKPGLALSWRIGLSAASDYKWAIVVLWVLAEVLGGRRDASERIVTVPPRGIEARGSTEIYPVDPPWLADALAFIHGSVEECLTAGDVARRSGFATQQYFGLCFARRHGVSPSVWRSRNK